MFDDHSKLASVREKRLGWGLSRAALTRIAASGLLMAAVFLTAGREIPELMADFLLVEQPVRSTKFAILLNGSEETRLFFAAMLYRAGVVDKIALAKAEDSTTVELGLVPNETDLNVSVLRRLEVPDSAILVLPGQASSTRDEAVAFQKYLAGSDTTEVLLITSAFHTRRASWIFGKALSKAGVSVRSVGVRESYDLHSWWKHEKGVLDLFEEYLKLGYYYTRYSFSDD